MDVVSIYSTILFIMMLNIIMYSINGGKVSINYNFLNIIFPTARISCSYIVFK